MDFFDKHGATVIAAQIQLYWASHGATGVKAWIEPFQQTPDGEILYHVRSNVVEILGGNTYWDSVLRRSSNSTVH